MSTQWSFHAATGKATGLRYEALPPLMRYAQVPKADRAAVFAGVRVMELAAIEALRDG